ncbi:MAG: hypothetical protein WCJ64_19840 [Rhodospirillaceae bacterium]
MITEADVIAIRRTYATTGKDAALVELRRRFMSLPESAAPKVLAKVVRLPVAPPAAYRQSGEPVLDNRRRAMRE